MIECIGWDVQRATNLLRTGQPKEQQVERQLRAQQLQHTPHPGLAADGHPPVFPN